MAVIKKIYVGDVGTEIIIDMGASVVGATNIKFIVKKPEKANPANTETVEWIPVIVAPNFFKYVVAQGDLDVAGYYEIRPEFTLGSWSGSGNKVGFTVKGK